MKGKRILLLITIIGILTIALIISTFNNEEIEIEAVNLSINTTELVEYIVTEDMLTYSEQVRICTYIAKNDFEFNDPNCYYDNLYPDCNCYENVEYVCVAYDEREYSKKCTKYEEIGEYRSENFEIKDLTTAYNDIIMSDEEQTPKEETEEESEDKEE